MTSTSDQREVRPEREAQPVAEMSEDDQGGLAPLTGAGDPAWVRAVDRFTTGLVWVVGALVVLMALNIIIDVVGRNVLNMSIYGTTELVSFVWMPGIACLALGYAQFRNEHIRVTLLLENLSPRAERVLDVFAELVALLLAVWIIQLCWYEFTDSRALGETATGLTWLPKWPGRLCLVLAYAGVIAGAAARLYRLTRGSTSRDEHAPFDEAGQTLD